ncbi:MAG: VCBS repeat-containing protein, partial [candidate division WOR-3 bacterium]
MLELCMALVAGSWTETRPQDFMDGWYSDLLYVSRRLMVEGANPSDSGAVEFVPRFDANRDGYCDLFSSEYSGPTVRIWLGGPTGYSGSHVLTYPTSGGADCDMADLNLDGWPEFVSSGWVGNACRIFWGSQAYGGPDPANYTQLPHYCAEDVYIYDLDRDTYLDIILGEDYSDTGRLRVYWGGPGGYSPSNCSSRKGFKWISHNIEVADLNKDGYSDVVMTRSKDTTNGIPAGGINILWGDATPRDLSDNPIWFHVDTPRGYDWHGITLADFNKDGWLDIVVSKWASATSVSRIYFSDGGSFEPANMISLNVKECWGGSSAWDFNGDGWLDLLFFRGYFQRYPLLLCLNSGSPPYFNIADTVRIGRDGCYASGTVGDFNMDGKPDIFGNEGDNGALVYWGVQATGTYDSVQTLPRLSSEHHSTFREPGNVYDRSPTEWYESGIFSEPLLQSEA